MQSLNQTTDEFFYFILLNFFLFCSLNEKRTSCSVAFAWKYPPFRLIKLGHREETFLKGIEQRQQNIRTTVENSESPTFKNVILACDSSTLIFDYIFWAFFVLKETESTGKHITFQWRSLWLPQLTVMISSWTTDTAQKDKVVYEKQCSLKLNSKGKHSLNKIHEAFVRSGAELCACWSSCAPRHHL